MKPGTLVTWETVQYMYAVETVFYFAARIHKAERADCGAMFLTALDSGPSAQIGEGASALRSNDQRTILEQLESGSAGTG